MKVLTEALFCVFLIVFALSWMDTLWIFGVENSKDYTMWKLIQVLAE